MVTKFFDHAYGLETQDQVTDLYSQWAASYDDEVRENGYASPQRCAQALALYHPPNASILDIGCGTGLSGVALAAAGFTHIDGTDPNPAMMDQAGARGVYQSLRQTDLDDPYPFKPGRYAAISAIGVIGSGAAPAALLTQTIGALGAGGLMVFSLNDHTLAIPEFPETVSAMLRDGVAEQVFCEYGAHLPAKNIRSNVYVLRRR